MASRRQTDRTTGVAPLTDASAFDQPTASRRRALQSSEEYCVGWIAALPLERAAAHQLLDERHDPPKKFKKNPTDHNNYSWGRMAGHNVVVASLPTGQYGLASAATTALNMLSSLPHVRTNLLVGIGAGLAGEHLDSNGTVKTTRDIRLGDVAVSSPEGTTGGVVQYDLGKALATLSPGTLQRKGFLNTPPLALANAVSRLQSEHFLEDSKISVFLQTFDANPKTRASYAYPGAHQDWLRQSTGQTSGVDLRDHAKIHYGTIASGNTLIKSAQARDAIIAQLSLEGIEPICFEMEAAGLMNDFPCLVIRGIADYADVHKGDSWQMYAAATAASFAKELLTYVDVEEVRIAENHSKSDYQIGFQLTALATSWQDNIEQAQLREVMDWICPVDYANQLQDNINKCHPGTAQWFLEDSRFVQWANENSKGALFCPGDPGCGKTMIATLAISHLLHSVRSRSHPVVFAFCNYSRQNEQTAQHLLSSFTRQLLHTTKTVPLGLQHMYQDYREKRIRPAVSDLEKALRFIMHGVRGMHIVLDAVNECKDTERTLLVSCIRSLMGYSKRCSVCLMVTSRHQPAIEKLFQAEADRQLEIKASPADIELFVRFRASELPSSIFEDHNLLEELVQCVVQSAGSMFLLAQLHMHKIIQETTPTPRAIKRVLSKLPTGSDAYDRTYSEAMQRLASQSTAKAMMARRALTWIVCATRPLSPLELKNAIAIERGQRDLDSDDLVDFDSILSGCDGLVRVDKESKVVRLVHSTTQEYLQKTCNDWFPDANVLLAESCLVYLSYDEFRPGPCNNGEQLRERIDQYPMLRYAASNWGTNLRMVEQIDPPTIFDGLVGLATHFLADPMLVTASVQASDFYSTPNYDCAQYANGSTACHLLAHFNLTKTFQAVHSVSKDFNASNAYGRTPLSYAAQFGSKEMVELLLDSKEGMTAMYQAVVHGQEGPVQLLYENHHVTPDARDTDDRTALVYAAREGRPNLVSVLLDRYNVNPDSTDRFGRTPLSYAAEHGHSSIVDLLLSSPRVNVNAKDHDGVTPLSRAALQGSKLTSQAILKALRDDASHYMENVCATYLLVLGKCRSWANRITAGSLDEPDLQAAAQAGQSLRLLEELEPALLNKPETIEGLSAAQFTILMWYLQKAIICDRCAYRHVRHGYHCWDCASQLRSDNTGFDICGECLGNGRWCLNSEHRLLEFGARESDPFRIAWKVFDPRPARADDTAVAVMTAYRIGRRTCDRCLRKDLQHGFHCTVCVDGRFDVCPSCIEKGLWCNNKLHELHIYQVKRGLMDCTPSRWFGQSAVSSPLALSAAHNEDDLYSGDDDGDDAEGISESMLESFHSALGSADISVLG